MIWLRVIDSKLHQLARDNFGEPAQPSQQNTTPAGCSKDHPARPFEFSLFLFRGVVEAALYCAHRVIYMFPPSLLVSL